MHAKRFSLLFCLLVIVSVAGQSAAGAERLKVSDNRRYLVCEDGRPFFYLGDAARKYPAPGSNGTVRTRP